MVGQETEKEEAGGVPKGQVKGRVVRKREKSAGLVHCLAAKTLLICNPKSLSSCQPLGALYQNIYMIALLNLGNEKMEFPKGQPVCTF